MTKFPIPKKMNTNIWNSSKMAGTGGALKALTKNLASQLTLNRTEMKRVVARVISERHGQGDVGDYNGHMFYVRPERIDMTKQITHSKEAFDEMVDRKRMQRLRSKSNVNQTQHSLSGSNTLKYNMPVRLKPDKNLTGVIIDQNHLRRRDNSTEIAVQMPKLMKLTKSKQCIKRKSMPTAQLKNPINRQINKLNIKVKPEPSILIKSKSKSKFTTSSQSKSKPLTNKKSVAKPSQKSANRRPSSNVKRSPQRQTLDPGGLQRLPAGNLAPSLLTAVNEQPSVYPTEATTKPKPKSSLPTKKKITKQLLTKPKRTNNYDQPWLEQRSMKSGSKRLSAGGILTRPSRSALATGQKLRIWRNPYQFPGGAGATRQPNPKPNPIALARSKLKIKNKQLAALRNKMIKSVSVVHRSKRSQLRLVKKLQREQAIDEPERLEAGTFRLKRSASVPPKRVRRMYKLSSRLKELAKPSMHRTINLELANARSRSCSPMRKPNLKLRTRRRRRRVLVDSSLGSIEGLGVTSRSGLTPAKCNLTLAFMNKDGGRTPRSPRSPRSVLWR